MRSHSSLIQFHTRLQQQLNIKTVIIALELTSHLCGFMVMVVVHRWAVLWLQRPSDIWYCILSCGQCVCVCVCVFVCVYMDLQQTQRTTECVYWFMELGSVIFHLCLQVTPFMNPAHMLLEIIYCHLLIVYSRCFYCVCVLSCSTCILLAMFGVAHYSTLLISAIYKLPLKSLGLVLFLMFLMLNKAFIWSKIA